jgi:hypothetical protein
LRIVALVQEPCQIQADLLFLLVHKAKALALSELGGTSVTLAPGLSNFFGLLAVLCAKMMQVEFLSLGCIDE